MHTGPTPASHGDLAFVIDLDQRVGLPFPQIDLTAGAVVG
jgi:hypothetical protein